MTLNYESRIFSRKVELKAYRYYYGINNRIHIYEIQKKYRKTHQKIHIARTREWEKMHPDSVKTQWLRRAYGITLDDYRRMENNQNGKCAICHQDKKLTVDHDHLTGKVRGLLCNNCNNLLSQAKDSIENLREAIIYLGGMK